MHLAIESNVLTANRVLISAQGELDVSSAPLLKSELAGHLSGGRVQVIIDMTKVTFVDSSGLSALVGALKNTVEQGGLLRLVVTNDSVLRIFKITALDQAFDIYADLDGALSD